MVSALFEVLGKAKSDSISSFVQISLVLFFAGLLVSSINYYTMYPGFFIVSFQSLTMQYPK